MTFIKINTKIRSLVEQNEWIQVTKSEEFVTELHVHLCML